MTFVADTTTTVNGHSVGIYFGFVLGVVNKIYVVVEGGGLGMVAVEAEVEAVAYCHA